MSGKMRVVRRQQDITDARRYYEQQLWQNVGDEEISHHEVGVSVR